MASSAAFNFTKATLEALSAPAGGVRLVVRDSKTPGLELRVTKHGIKTFCIRRRVKGGDVERITIGRFPEISVDKARYEANKHIAKLAVGTSIVEERRELKGTLRFSDLFAQYVTRHAKPSKRTWAEDVSKYDMHLARPLGTRKLSSITRRDIAAIHSELTLKGTVVAANRVLALVSSIFGWARSAGIWETNPASGIKRNAEKSRDRFLQPDELPRFFAALAVEPNETLRDYILLSLLTGARRADVLSMQWRDVTLDRAEWRIKRTKNDDPITITLSTEAVAILTARYAAKTGVYVFPGDGKAGHFSQPYKGWKRVLLRTAALGFTRAVAAAERLDDPAARTLETAVLTDPKRAVAEVSDAATRHCIKLEDFVFEDIRIHDLRRTLGSWQARQGASLAVIGKSLNHRSIATTAIYARLDQDPVRQSVQAASSAILEAAGVKKAADVVPISKTG